MTLARDKGKTIIFLCVANSARSQMAEGLAKASAPPGWQVYSAGSKPNAVNPLAVEVLREIGIDIANNRSKGVEAVPLEQADVVVTLCEEEVCPVIPANAEHLDWAMPDPVGMGDQIRFQLEAFRETRDEIKCRVDSFWAARSA